MKRMTTRTKHSAVAVGLTQRRTVLPAVCATTLIFGLLVCCRGAYSQAARPGGHAQFEQASALVPAGNTCILHPEENEDPSQSMHVRSDADGVVRFLAVRPTLPSSVDRLALDCTDSQGNASTYHVDLRSEETFVPRPFNPSLANLAFRPALTGDPLSFTQDQLVEAGYGVRPDPIEDPDGYKTWLAAVSVPAYKLKAAPRAVSTPGSSHQQAPIHIPADKADLIEPEAVYLSPSGYWTGALMNGSYQKNSTSAKTYGYVENQANFNVPTINPGGFGTKSTSMTIWNGLDNVFQAIVDVDATSSIGDYNIHRQSFYHSKALGSSLDQQGADFTPNAGDEILVQEWYCDSKGHVKMAGGFGCSNMMDITQAVLWECDQSNSTDCQSYPIESQYLTNGALGTSAEYIIEDDTAEKEGAGNCPSEKTNCYDEWVDFSPVVMIGSALVVKGTSQTGKTVTTGTDPAVQLLTDNTSSVPFVFGDGHLLISLPKGGGAVKWSEVHTNIYYWNGTNFDSLTTPQGMSNARPGVIFGCASSIAVGPNSHGLTRGTPWITGCNEQADGNYDVYQMQTGGAWVLMQDDVATQLAVSPEGDAWAINAKGDVLYWNGSKFVTNPTGGCATAIAVGPNSFGLKHGTPWILGCDTGADSNYDLYQMQTDGKWVKIQDDVGYQISASPVGSVIWAIDSSNILRASIGGGPFIQPITVGEFSPGGCVTSVAAGPSLTPWFTGCFYAVPISGSGGPVVYRLGLDDTVQEMSAAGGVQIAMSPEGNPWIISNLNWPVNP